MTDLKVNGAMLGAFAQACINHKILLGESFKEFSNIEPQSLPTMWFDLDIYKGYCQMVKDRYDDNHLILKKVGVEMMNLWYHHGPGKSLVSSAEDFLRFQTGNKGYYSMVSGDEKAIGSFSLEYFSDDGAAVIRSNTPLDRNVEVGVIQGGVDLFESTAYSKVTLSEDNNFLFCEFH